MHYKIFSIKYKIVVLNKISVVIITFNEARNILRCLTSVCAVADEIVVVDSFSTDETEAICTDFVVANDIALKFVNRKFEGYGAQKQHATTYASHNWLLSLDADEALSPELCAAILTFKHSKNGLANAYTFNRLTNYCGSWIRHCGWYPDAKIRLWQTEKAAWTAETVHETVQILSKTSKIAHLQGDLLHYSFATHAELVAQIDKFSTIAAQARFEKGETASYFKIFYKTAFKFFRNYVLKLGFLDGKNGLIISFWTAKETFWRYGKLRELHRKGL